MKKYLQIIIVLGGFFFLVFLKNIRADDEHRVIGIPSSSSDNSSNNSLQLPSSQNSTSQAPTPTQISPSSQAPTPIPVTNSSRKFKDGVYTGSVEDAFYGNIQVQAIISSGKLTDINFLQYPNDNGTSRSINEQALPILKSEALQAQSASVDLVSGASDSSPAFVRSLDSALSKAK